MKWTTDEIEYLNNRSKGKSIEQIAFDLNRSYASVLMKMSKLGLSETGTRARFFGCNEDCFNCNYKDCYKPSADCYEGKWKRTKEEREKEECLNVVG